MLPLGGQSQRRDIVPSMRTDYSAQDSTHCPIEDTRLLYKAILPPQRFIGSQDVANSEVISQRRTSFHAYVEEFSTAKSRRSEMHAGL